MTTKGYNSIPLEPWGFYHIYNRAIGSDNLFHDIRNYSYFLKKYNEYLSGYVKSYAYCLLPNHFHLLIRVRDEKELVKVAQLDMPDFQNLAREKEEKAIRDAIPLRDSISESASLSPDKIVSEQFRRFFIAYSQAINKQKGRKGSLFMKPFKRKLIGSERSLRNVVIYIHNNPAIHGFTDTPENYQWSSYKSCLSGKSSKLQREEVLNWFEGRKNFVYCHKARLNQSAMEGITLE